MTINLGGTVKELRIRKGLQEEYLLQMLSNADYFPVLNRIERGMLLPKPDAVPALLEALGAPMEEIVYSTIGDEPTAHMLRHTLLHALDNKYLPEAQAIYENLTAIVGGNGDDTDTTTQQFILSQRARLLELQGKPASEIMPLVYEGLMLTLDDFNEDSPGEAVLVYEEPELFHTLARLHAKGGNFASAIKILTDTLRGLQKLPTGERERDRRIVPIVLSLADCQLKAGDYSKVLETCELGIHTAAMRSAGQGIPEFMLYNAAALFSLGNAKEEIAPWLKMSFAGHIMLGERDMAMDVLRKSKEDFGISFKTYGMEELDIPQSKKVPYAQGTMPHYGLIGYMIRFWRDEARLNQKQLCQGICSASNLNKIEKGEIHGHMHYIEPIMQRLGRDPLLYFNFFLLLADFEAKELRDMIHLLMGQRKHKAAATALEKLKTYKAYGAEIETKPGTKARPAPKPNLQFVKRIEATLYAAENRTKDGPSPETERKLLEALHITWPQFKEKDISSYPLTLDESVLINYLANYYMENKELERAAKMYKGLIDNLKKRYVDEREMARMYGTVMFNYSTCLGRMEMRVEALEVIDEAAEFSRIHSRLSTLPVLMGNKAFNLYKRGKEVEALPYLALAYYGCMMFKDYGRAGHMSIIQDQAMRFFDIQFD